MNATHTVGAVARRGRREDESFGTMFTAWVAIFFALISPCARVGSGDRASEIRRHRSGTRPGGVYRYQENSRRQAHCCGVGAATSEPAAPSSPLQPPECRLGPICRGVSRVSGLLGRVNGGELIQRRHAHALVFCNQFILREARRAARRARGTPWTPARESPAPLAPAARAEPSSHARGISGASEREWPPPRTGCPRTRPCCARGSPRSGGASRPEPASSSASSARGTTS